MAKKISCAALGKPECSFNAEANSEEELLKQVAEHAAHEHNINEVSQEFREQIINKIQED